MDKLKQCLLRLLFPHIALVILLVPVSAALLFYTFMEKSVTSAVTYLSYALSAYALTILCARVPVLIRKVRTAKEENRYAALYFSDAALRVKLSLYSSSGMNLLYALLQLALGMINRSVWFYALAGYYFLLAVIRILLLRTARRITPGKDLFLEYRCCRLCGAALLFMDIALSVIAFYMVCQNRGFIYHDIAAIAMASYTFAAFTVAVVNVIRYRKYNSPILSAAKQISFASALVSMLSLETAMLNAFGDGDNPSFRFKMTAATGAAVCVTVLGLAVHMLVRSTQKLKQKSETGE